MRFEIKEKNPSQGFTTEEGFYFYPGQFLLSNFTNEQIDFLLKLSGNPEMFSKQEPPAGIKKVNVLNWVNGLRTPARSGR